MVKLWAIVIVTSVCLATLASHIIAQLTTHTQTPTSHLKTDKGALIPNAQPQ